MCVCFFFSRVIHFNLWHIFFQNFVNIICPWYYSNHYFSSPPKDSVWLSPDSIRILPDLILPNLLIDDITSRQHFTYHLSLLADRITSGHHFMCIIPNKWLIDQLAFNHWYSRSQQITVMVGCSLFISWLILLHMAQISLFSVKDTHHPLAFRLAGAWDCAHCSFIPNLF